MNRFHAETPSRTSVRQTGHFDPEFEMLLAAARTAPNAARMEALADTGLNWEKLWELAGTHGVRLLVYQSLQDVCWNQIPPRFQDEWREAYQYLSGKNKFLTGEVLRINQAFAEAGIQIVFMKGVVIAAMAYGDFALREFNDIDLLVAETDFARAVDLIESLGFRRLLERDNYWVQLFLCPMGEYKLTSRDLGTDIDLHWKLAHRSVALSPSVDDFPSGFQPTPIAGSSVLTLAVQDLPLYLASQGGGDEWRDFRRICDVAEFMRRFPKVDWRPHLEIARRLGGERSMLTGLALAANLFGVELPPPIASRIHSDSVVHRLTQRAIQNLQSGAASEEAVSRYSFQLQSKTGIAGKIALARSILTDRTAEDASWIMLPRPLWWLYTLLRPIRIFGRLLTRRS